MTRPIKFRAWSIKKRKYIDIDDLYCANGKVCGVVYDGVVYDIDDVVLEQDTGLKDKNGERICEGDIVKCEGSGAVVIWRGENAGFGIRWLDCGVEDELDYWNTLRGPAEVIGNIHENPELLEGKKGIERKQMTKKIKICVERVWHGTISYKYHLEKNPVAKIELHEEGEYGCYAIAILDEKDLAKFINWMIDNVADVVISRRDEYDFEMTIYDDYME